MNKLFTVAMCVTAVLGMQTASAENLIHSGGTSGDYQPFAEGMPSLIGAPIAAATWQDKKYTVSPSGGAADNAKAVCNDETHTDFGIAQSNMVFDDCVQVVQQTRNPEIHFMLINKFVSDKVDGYSENPLNALGFVQQNLEMLKFVSADGSGHMDTHNDLAARIGLPAISVKLGGSLEMAQYIAENSNAVAIFTQRARPDSKLLKYIQKNDDKVSIVPIFDMSLRGVKIQERDAYQLCPDQQMGARVITSICSPMVIIASSQMDENRSEAMQGVDLTPAIPVEGWMSKAGRSVGEQFASGQQWANDFEMPDFSNIDLSFDN